MTTEGLRVVELATGDVMHFTYIRDISFSTHLHSGYDRQHVGGWGRMASCSNCHPFVDSRSLLTFSHQNPEHDIFAYIGKDDKLSRTVCHLFKCPPGVARDITKTAAFAFRICIEEMQRVERDNPFEVGRSSSQRLLF